MRVFLVLVALVALSCLAESYFEFRESTSVYYGHNAKGWEKRQRAADSDIIPLVFAVKLRNVDKLEQILLEVSDPTNPSWGKFLTLNELGDLTADYAATNAITAWLRSSGVAAQDIIPTVNGDWIKTSIPARLAESLLNCEFYHFVHLSTGVSTIRTDIYRLPLAIADRVDYVASSISVANPRPSPVFTRAPAVISNRTLEAIPSGYVGPSTINTVYGITNNIVASASATQAVYENLGQSFSPSDVSAFDSTLGVPTQTVQSVIGPNTASSCASNANNCVEADLDVEYITAVAQNAPTTFWSIANSDNSPFLDWIVAVAEQTNPPLVHSISYGDIEQDDDPTTMQRFNTEVMKLGVRGVSVLVASGDDGVANFQARTDASQCGFHPSFPASASYVTAVGATQGPESGSAEIACTSSTNGQITSGGGFSTVFSQPSYQSSVVNNYLANGPNLPPTSQFNAQGRGYPDVALLGHNYVIEIGGQLNAGSGTSASTPVFAGIITLINGLRIEAGKKPLGFLNQILYQLAASTPSAFNDITSGENNCAANTGTSPICCQYGFTATTGWDPITGLGSINFGPFSQALVNLP